MTTISINTIAAGVFGVIFVVTLLVLAIKFPKPTAFQYTVFRIVLAIAVAGIALFIPGLLEVTISNIVQVGGALGVFVVVYFFSPVKLIVSQSRVDLPALVKAWDGIRTPNINDLDIEMAHKALNALGFVTWYWNNSSSDER